MLRVRTIFSGVTGSPWLQVSYWTGTDNQTQADAAVAAISAFWGAVDNLMGTSVSWVTDPEVAVLTTAGVRTGGFVTTPGGGTGSSGTSLLPISTQALVRLLTGSFIAGRQVRGQINVPGLTTTQLSSAGQLASAAQTTIQTAANTLNSATAPDLVVWSRKNATAIAVSTVSVPVVFSVRRSRRD